MSRWFAIAIGMVEVRGHIRESNRKADNVFSLGVRWLCAQVGWFWPRPHTFNIITMATMMPATNPIPTPAMNVICIARSEAKLILMSGRCGALV
jgi:hypothetical protein